MLSNEVLAVEDKHTMNEFKKRKEHRGRRRFTWIYVAASIACVLFIFGVGKAMTSLVERIEPAPQASLNSVTDYEQEYAYRFPDSKLVFSSSEDSAELPGLESMSYGRQPGEPVEVVIYQFGSATEAQSAYSAYAGDISARLNNNILIAAPKGELKTEYIQALNLD